MDNFVISKSVLKHSVFSMSFIQDNFLLKAIITQARAMELTLSLTCTIKKI